MGERLQIALHDTAQHIAAPDGAGPVYVSTAPSAAHHPGGALHAHDTDGRRLWIRRFDEPVRGLKVGDGGEVWVAQGRTLRATGPDGSHLWAVRPRCEPGDRLDAFLVLRDGFLVAWGAPPGSAATPRIERIGRDGSRMWNRELPPVLLGGWVAALHPGRRGEEVGGEGGEAHRGRPEEPRPPASFRPAAEHPLIVSGDRSLATCVDLSTGLGVAFCLDLATGAVAWTTPAHPVGSRAAADAEGSFLVGAQGPDAFETHLFDRNGQDIVRWDAHGMYTVSSTGTIRCLELDESGDERSRLCVLDRDGSVRAGVAVGGHHSSHPALTSGRRAVFCRNDHLWAIDFWMAPAALGALRMHDRPVVGRTLLLDDGVVAVTRRDELLLFLTGLGPLDDGAWPCGEGNVRGNPVVTAPRAVPGPLSVHERATQGAGLAGPRAGGAPAVTRPVP